MKTIYLLLNSIHRNIDCFSIQHKKIVPDNNKSQENTQHPHVNFLSYNYFRTGFILFFAGLFFSPATIAQTNPEYTRSYLNNVVEIGLSDFGLITGEDSAHIYFIAVRRTLTEKDDFEEKIATTIKKVKFFSNSYKAKATKVIDVRFGAFTVVLYKSPKPASGTWQRDYYHSMAYKKGKLSTFRDKWLSDKIWAVQEAKISVVKMPKAGVVTVRVPGDAGIAKGMPLVNSDGFIGGIFAESTLGKTVVRVINMKEIADALYVAARNKCRYFNMVEWGKSDIRCVLEENARLAALEKARLEAEAKLDGGKKAKKSDEAKDTSEVNTVSSKKREQKKHFLDYGINANILTNPIMDDKTNGKDNYLKTRAFHLGLSLHLNIDKKGLNRITLKPRYGNFHERKDAGLWKSTDNEVTIVTTSYQYIEMPVVIERQLFRGEKFTVALGAGYSPGRLLNQRYSWLNKSGVTPINQTIAGSAIRHRLLGELYLYESGFGRLGIVYTRDMSAYPNADYKMAVNGADYTPFASRKKAWYVGVELGIRLRGGWAK